MNMAYFVKPIHQKPIHWNPFTNWLIFQIKNLQYLLFTFYHLLKISPKLKLTHLKPKNVQLLAQGHIIGKLQSWGKDSCFLVSYYLYLQQFCETGLGLIVQWGNQSTEKLGNLCNITQLTIWQSREGHQSSLSREMLLLTTDCAPMSSSANKTRRCGTSVVCISLYLLFYITIQY